LFDDPESSETADLYAGEEVHAVQLDFTQEHVVWLVFRWHEDNEESLHKLQQNIDARYAKKNRITGKLY